MPASFKDQLALVDELLAEVRRMEHGERRRSAAPLPGGYEQELRLAGLAQRVAQAYTIMEGVLAFVARRIDRTALTGEDWHKKLILRSTQPCQDPPRPAVISAELAGELLELCQFRHVVRSIYPTRLDAVRVAENLQRLIGCAPQFGTQCRAFATGLPAAGKTSRNRATPRRRKK